LSLVGAKGTTAFFPLVERKVVFFVTAFFGELLITLDFPAGDFVVAIFAPSSQNSVPLSKHSGF
jgi:hypothetical protein